MNDQRTLGSETQHIEKYPVTDGVVVCRWGDASTDIGDKRNRLWSSVTNAGKTTTNNKDYDAGNARGFKDEV